MTDAATATRTTTENETTNQTQRPWLWNIVLYDSDDHTYEYVIDMLSKVFAFPIERGFTLARAIDRDGRGVVLTTHRELAELKAQQVRAFGPDHRIASCTTALRVALEPAERD